MRRKDADGFRVYYNSVSDYAKAPDKVDYIQGKAISEFEFAEIMPDAKSNWLDQSASDFDELLPLAKPGDQVAKTIGEEQAVFKLNALGVNTARDEWVYDFDDRTLRDKVLFSPTLTTNSWTTGTNRTPRSAMERGNAQSFQAR